MRFSSVWLLFEREGCNTLRQLLPRSHGGGCPSPPAASAKSGTNCSPSSVQAAAVCRWARLRASYSLLQAPDAAEAAAAPCLMPDVTARSKAAGPCGAATCASSSCRGHWTRLRSLNLVLPRLAIMRLTVHTSSCCSSPEAGHGYAATRTAG